ncbi:hypothetical protein [Mycolicibacterium neoaurum]|nr:hypothetical protein [Mycolicibacterium neoaurum]
MTLIHNAGEDLSNEAAATAKVIQTIKERLVGGKVKIVEGGETKLVDIEADDIDSMPSTMVDRIFADMTGVKYDADPLEPTAADDESSTDTSSTKQQEPTITTETQ